MFNFLKKIIVILMFLFIIAQIMILTIMSKYAELIYQKYQEPVPTYIQPVLIAALIVTVIFAIAITAVIYFYLSEKVDSNSDEYLEYLKFKEYKKQKERE